MKAKIGVGEFAGKQIQRKQLQTVKAKKSSSNQWSWEAGS